MSVILVSKIYFLPPVLLRTRHFYDGYCSSFYELYVLYVLLHFLLLQDVFDGFQQFQRVGLLLQIL